MPNGMLTGTVRTSIYMNGGVYGGDMRPDLSKVEWRAIYIYICMCMI